MKKDNTIIVWENTTKTRVDEEVSSVGIENETLDVVVDDVAPLGVDISDDNIVDIEISEAFPFVTDGALEEDLQGKDILIDGGVALKEDQEVVRLEDILEKCAALGGSDNIAHGTLYGVEFPNQHPITAITNLREELDSIEALQTVYSDKQGCADYYPWEDENPAQENRVGHFVAICGDARTIKICSSEDIFGVVVDRAAFIGGRDQVLENHTIGGVGDVAQSSAYGLVATTGTAVVYCETDVAVGDYVVSNDDGFAKKSSGHFGYLVIAINEFEDIKSATVSLSIPTVALETMSHEIDVLDKRIDVAETNVTSAINIANAAYKMASENDNSVVTNEELLEIVENAVVDMNADMNRVETNLADAMVVVERAQKVSENAAATAESIRKDAVDTANKALDEVSQTVDNFNATVEQIKNTADDANTKAQATNEGLAALTLRVDDNESELLNIVQHTYIDEDGNELTGLAAINQEVTDHGSSIEALSDWEDESEKAIADLQIRTSRDSASICSIVSLIDTYSLGERSQANGLTLAQAANILEAGSVYVPIEDHSETYGEAVYEFSKGYHYTWDGAKWQESDSPFVAFFEQYVSGNSALHFWVPAAKIIKDGIEYEKDTLYMWKDERWLAVATLKDNANSRATSMILQEQNSILLSVNNAHKDIAALDLRVDEAENRVGLVVSKEGDYYVVNSASIIAAVNGDGSSVGINADRIVMTGEVTFLKPEDVGENGATVIDGGRIVTGQVSANNIDVSGVITAGRADIGEIVADTIQATKITADNIDANAITSDKIDANAITSDKIDANAITARHISANSITADAIDAGAITASKIDACAITADKIDAKAITSDKIDAGAITADHIAVGAITAGNVDVSGIITAGTAEIEGVISAADVVAQNLKVYAANIEGVLTIGKLPSSVATTDDIPTESEITTITNNTISTTNVTAKNLKVDAANITGTLTVGTIPSSIARSSEIPTSTSDLYNDSGFQSYNGVTTIIGSTVTTGFIEALNISVNSAQIKDKLTADKIDVNDLIASGSIIVSGDNMSALNNDLDFQSSSDVTTIVGNTVTTGFVEALKIHVKAAQIDDALTIGQLPDTVAEKSDVPTKTSDLTNDSGFTNESGVTTIIDGRITTDYIEALNISVSSAQIKDKLTADKIDANGISATNVSISGTLTAGNGSTIGPFYVGESSLSAMGDDGLSYNSMSKDGISCTNLSANYATISGGSITASGGSLSGMSSMSTDHATVGSDSVSVRNGANGFWHVTMSAGDSYASLSGSGASISFTGSAATLNGTWTAGSCLGTASDERVKNSILPLSTDARYDTMFDALAPSVYKYNDGTSGRTHTGYIAQDVLAAVENAGLTSTDFAGYIKAKEIDQETGEETETCYLRYEEFIALNTAQIQKLKARVAELETKLLGDA